MIFAIFLKMAILIMTIFVKKLKKSYIGWILGFLRIHPKYDFRDFLENGNSDNGYFREKFKKGPSLKMSILRFLEIKSK